MQVKLRLFIPISFAVIPKKQGKKQIKWSGMPLTKYYWMI